MKAIVAKSGSDAQDKDAFILEEQPIPEPGPQDLLVRVISIGMNPVDTKVRQRFENDAVLGWDAYGIVEKTGDRVTGFKAGDKVFYAGDITRPGSNSEYHLVDYRIAALAPQKLSPEDAVAMPLTSITAWEGLFERLGFVPQASANTGKSILIIGAGPIVIGQACEFDYSGTQACKALREEDYRVVLLNSNPATIMTDPDFADRTYVEPVTPLVLSRIIEQERPDALLPTLGGQTALNTAVAVAEAGVLDKFGVELIGARLGPIKKAEDRTLFKQALRQILPWKVMMFQLMAAASNMFFNARKMSLVEALDLETDGLMAQAARLLKLRRTTLVEKLGKYGIAH